MDPSNGYELISSQFLSHRGKSGSHGIGVQEVRNWAARLPPGASVIDLGCGSGFPLTSVLVDTGLNVFGVDASPSLVTAFKQNLPGTPILCQTVQASDFFNRSFEAALAWGLIFLLNAEDQRRLIQRLSQILVPKGRLLFTAPPQIHSWNDVMTGLESISLGVKEYGKLLNNAGLTIESEYEDTGGNHYYDAIKSEWRGPISMHVRGIPTNRVETLSSGVHMDSAEAVQDYALEGAVQDITPENR